MGALYDFHCPKCGYRAEVSGGDDCGMISQTTTILCEECRELYDITTKRISGEGPLEKEKVFKFRCPKRARHSIKKWEEGGLCPKCSAVMENRGPTLIWD